MTLAVMGYHLQVITRKLSKAVDAAMLTPELDKSAFAETGRQPH
jgi:hypothetical protein